MNTTSMPLQPDHLPTVFLHGFSGDCEGIRPFATVYSGPDAICINLPGFGGTSAPKHDKTSDIRSYARDVWKEVRKAVPNGPVNLVGHSHGAMVGYVLAVEHSTEVARLDLFCPVARPRIIPRTTIGAIRLMQAIGIPSRVIISFLSHPRMVALVTRYTMHADWSKGDRRRITEMRQHEAKFYSPLMFDLMQQTLQFTDVMDGSYCSVPTRICYVNDENVSSDTDHVWYETHANVIKKKEISGGHLCVVANPERVVSLFGTEEDI